MAGRRRIQPNPIVAAGAGGRAAARIRMSFRSALYIGSVFHRRLKPKAHRFRYRLFWLLLDLDELEELARRLRLFALDRFGWLSLRIADHGDGSATPLRQQIEAALRTAGLAPPGGRIALL